MINPALAAMTGLDAERIRGLTPAAALPPFSAAIAEARFAEAVAAGIPIEYEETHDLPVGVRTYHTVLVPMQGRDGRVARLLGSARDVTARNHLQEEVVRTSKLAQFGTMAAGIAHELSQPLNVIRLWAANAQEDLAGGRVESRRQVRVLGIVQDQ